MSVPRSLLALAVALLWWAVLASAAAAVYSKYRARELFVELEQLNSSRDELDAEWGRLQLEQSAWSAYAFVERVASERLHMSIPDSRYGRAGELCWHLDMIPRPLLATRRGGGCARFKRPWRNATPGRVSAEFGASRSASPGPPHPGRPAAQRRRGPVQAAATRPARSCPPTRPLPP